MDQFTDNSTRLKHKKTNRSNGSQLPVSRDISIKVNKNEETNSLKPQVNRKGKSVSTATPRDASTICVSHPQSSDSSSSVNGQSGTRKISRIINEQAITTTEPNNKMSPNNGQFKCVECDLVFNHGSSLARHGKIHYGVLRCPQNGCGKAYSERKHLIQHLNRHSSTNLKVRILHFNIRPKIEVKMEQTHNKCVDVLLSQRPVKLTKVEGLKKRRIEEVQEDTSPVPLSPILPSSPSTVQFIDELSDVNGHGEDRIKEDNKVDVEDEENGKESDVDELLENEQIDDGAFDEEMDQNYDVEERDEQREDISNSQQVQVTVTSADSFVKQIGPQEFECDYQKCGKRFKARRYLIRHIHTGEKPFTCSVAGCDRAFAQGGQLKLHMMGHTGERKHQCDWPNCGRAFLRPSNLQRHRFSHSGVRNHQCDWPDCGKAFIELYTLKQHIRTHTRPFQCDQCDAKFAQRFSLVTHGRIHSGERPFACSWTNCHRSFITSSKLSRHIRLHEDGRVRDLQSEPRKKYACKYEGCQWSFTAEKDLARHERAHLGIKPYSCSWPDCGFSTVLRKGVVFHVRTQHFKLPSTLKEQQRLNIEDNRNANDFVQVDTQLEHRRLE